MFNFFAKRNFYCSLCDKLFLPVVALHKISASEAFLFSMLLLLFHSQSVECLIKRNHQICSNVWMLVPSLTIVSNEHSHSSWWMRLKGLSLETWTKTSITRAKHTLRLLLFPADLDIPGQAQHSLHLAHISWTCKQCEILSVVSKICSANSETPSGLWPHQFDDCPDTLDSTQGIL